MAEYMRLTRDSLPWYGGLLPAGLSRRLQAESALLALGAVENGAACGVMVVEFSLFGEEEMAEILYLAVAEGRRRRGIGSGLVRFFCRYAAEELVPVRCLFSAAGKEDPAYRFFASLPDFYLSEEEGCEYAVPLAELAGAEKLMAAERCVKTPEEFCSLPLQEQKAFVQSQREAGSFYLEDLYSRRDELVPRLCLCSRNGGRLEAAVFFLQGENGDLILDYAWCAQGRQAALISLLAQAARRICGSGAEGLLRIAAVEPQTEEIIKKLYPQSQVSARLYCAAMEL